MIRQVSVSLMILGLSYAPQGRAQKPAFEVASIKPNHSGTGNVMLRIEPGGRLSASNVTLKILLQTAYGVKDSQISGAPGWFDSDHFDVEAKPEDAPAAGQPKLGRDDREEQMKLMLQTLLADRFKLTLHHDTKELPLYALVVAKNGPKFHAAAVAPGDSAPPPPGPSGAPPGAPAMRHGIMMNGRGELTMTGATLERFADILSRQVGRLVVDKTGLKGEYDFTLKWTPDEGQGTMRGGPPGVAAPPPEASGPTIFTALQEQLGLKLETQKGPVDTIVIDHVERPSEN